MFNIESKIRRTAHEFDYAEPPAGHEAVFRSKLRAQSRKGIGFYLRQSFLLKVAALFFIGVSIPVIYYLVADYSNTEPYPIELTETQSFYNQLADQKLAELQQLAKANPSAAETVKVAKKEMDTLNSETELLKQQYLSSGKDQRVFDAFVFNLKSTVNLLETLLANAQPIPLSATGIKH